MEDRRGGPTWRTECGEIPTPEGSLPLRMKRSPHRCLQRANDAGVGTVARRNASFRGHDPAIRVQLLFLDPNTHPVRHAPRPTVPAQRGL